MGYSRWKLLKIGLAMEYRSTPWLVIRLRVCWEDGGISKSDLCGLGPQPLMFIRKSQRPENQIGRKEPKKMRFSFRFTSTFHKPNGGQLTKIRWNSFCVLRVLSTTLKWGTSDQIRWNYFIFVFSVPCTTQEGNQNATWQCILENITKIQNLQMEFCFFDLMSLDCVKNHLAIYSKPPGEWLMLIV